MLLPGVHPVEFGKPQIFTKHEAIGKIRMEYIEARKDEAREMIDIEFEAITEARKYDVDRWYQDAYKSQGLTPDGLELLEEEESDVEEEKVVVKECPPGAIKVIVDTRSPRDSKRSCASAPPNEWPTRSTSSRPSPSHQSPSTSPYHSGV